MDDRFTLTVLSFGFKHGLPPEADMVLDARCLPNPYYVPSLRPLTGQDAAVAAYVFGTEHARDFLQTQIDCLRRLLPLYRENRGSFTLAVGCTGGQHRSVACAEALAKALAAEGYDICLRHRESERDVVSAAGAACPG